MLFTEEDQVALCHLGEHGLEVGEALLARPVDPMRRI
jgi:hypothetical protein